MTTSASRRAIWPGRGACYAPTVDKASTMSCQAIRHRRALLRAAWRARQFTIRRASMPESQIQFVSAPPAIAVSPVAAASGLRTVVPAARGAMAPFVPEHHGSVQRRHRRAHFAPSTNSPRPEAFRCGPASALPPQRRAAISIPRQSAADEISPAHPEVRSAHRAASEISRSTSTTACSPATSKTCTQDQGISPIDQRARCAHSSLGPTLTHAAGLYLSAGLK
jgi:hypothetical protein